MGSEGDPVGLEVRELSIARRGRAVLRGASLTVRRRRVTVIVAPSGAGKSTLLRCCNGLLAPDSGEILLDGAPLASLEATALRRRVGLVGQLPVMLHGTVAENLAYGLSEHDDRSERALTRALEEAGLDAGFLARPAQALSGGERARVALARALTRGPELLLLDEPTAALDGAIAARIGETLRRLAHTDGLGILLATHDLAFAATIADDAVALRDGRAVEGAPDEVLAAAEAAARAGRSAHAAPTSEAAP
ncbi:MAG TPA: ABC transporter ATP-binding protein [Conexibacter sp.]|jgi:ABC-type cobalamin/Fe3+-siderophores transport system ATPase subunit